MTYGTCADDQNIFFHDKRFSFLATENTEFTEFLILIFSLCALGDLCG